MLHTIPCGLRSEGAKCEEEARGSRHDRVRIGGVLKSVLMLRLKRCSAGCQAFQAMISASAKHPAPMTTQMVLPIGLGIGMLPYLYRKFAATAPETKKSVA